MVDELDPSYNANWAKYAKVGMVEDMLDIDTMVGQQIPFDVNNPQKNWVGSSGANGWAKWYYATQNDESNGVNNNTNASNGIRDWVVVGCKDWFYIFNRTHSNQSINVKYRLIANFFGLLDGDWQQASAITAIISLYNSISLSSSNFINNSANYDCVFVNKSVKDKYDAVRFVTALSSYLNSNPIYTLGEPSDTNPVVFSNMPVFEKKTSIPRGYFPSIEIIYQHTAYPHLHTMLGSNRMKLAVRCMYFNDGLVLLDLGEK